MGKVFNLVCSGFGSKLMTNLLAGIKLLGAIGMVLMAVRIELYPDTRNDYSDGARAAFYVFIGAVALIYAFLPNGNIPKLNGIVRWSTP